MIDNWNHYKRCTESTGCTVGSDPDSADLYIMGDNKVRERGDYVKGIKNKEGRNTDFLKRFIAQGYNNATAKIFY